MDPKLTQAKLTDEQVGALVEAASQARERAYAPYSNFRVGAALLTGDGTIYPGCNIENGSYGMTLCAERAAVANAIIHGRRDFVAIALIAETDDAPVMPCGGCRQVLVEFNPYLVIISANTVGQRRVLGLDELLPHHFNFNTAAR
jgi:cytidine deaminase